jgi:hypothetical protein
MQKIQDLTTCESVYNLLDTWHKNLIDSFGSSLRKDKSSTKLLDILGVEHVDVWHHVLFNKLKQEWTSESTDRKPTRAACHFISTHLVKSRDKKSFQLDKKFWKLVWNFWIGLKDSQKVKSGHFLGETDVQITFKKLEKVYGSCMNLIETIGNLDNFGSCALLKYLRIVVEFIKVVEVSGSLILVGEMC